MTIGAASKASGVPAKMIRYYESIGLISKVARSDSGYRHYAMADIHTLRFIRRGRDLGFSIDAITQLLALWRDRNRASADVKRIALDHAAALRTKIADLQAMLGPIEHLADHCQGNHRPDCPIMDDLAASSRH
ncbi:Cu(I)-responsive transcriptional regulator [Acidiphilium acidophilum]|uniref:Cu(I)-responsive transcriptional regulator n=1 Tax=Acidiphilium acidophilum TaxID=76588 RepID=UPI002E8E6F19|nr:Cu(I)-responsive transcriptional regulator [Acidiphilium acidophilum]